MRGPPIFSGKSLYTTLCPIMALTSNFCRLLVACSPLLGTLGAAAQEQVLFESGDLGYACFRIPAMVTWGPGGLLAFAEGRMEGCADFGDVDILMRRSTDGGATWSAPVVVADNGNLQAGNATPILDELDPAYPGGRLFLFYNTGTASEYDTRMGQGRRRGFFITSTDRGATWSAPTDISGEIHFDRHSDRPEIDARTLAFAPGHGVQLKDGPSAGRLFVPANHSLGPPQDDFRDYTTYGAWSDDHGRTWHASTDLDIPSSNEAMATEVNGTLLLNVRMQNRTDRRKRMASSTDGGSHWDSTWIAETLTTPVCQSSILHVEEMARTYHLGPADTVARRNLALWSSTDGGFGWVLGEIVFPGAAAYSDMAYLGQGRLAILYERDDYARIVFSTLPLR